VNSAPVVDVHTHLAPVLDESVLRSGGLQEDGGRYVVDGHRVGVPALYDAPALVARLTSTGVDRAWVSIPPPFFRQGLDADGAIGWVRAANDGLMERISAYPSLELLAYLPLDQPQVALAEIDRLADDQRVIGWVGSAGGESLALDHPRLTAVWDRLEASGLPVLLHPGSSPDRRLDRHYLANLLGNPIETTVAAAELVFGDVLGRHPDLRLVLVHCGGAVATLMRRWQRGVDTSRPGITPLKLSPVDAVRRLWVDALAHDPAVVDLAVAVFGEDKIVLGSDWPFPMGLDDPWQAIAHLPAERRDRIARNNAFALRGIRR
jgi:aminocarboxymuconate-semialdehyde decarboxylase